MIYLTQLVYIKEGQEEAFNAFEEVAIPLIARHRGTLLLRYRPREEDVIDGTIERPYEIHFVSFDADADFQSFLKDDERKRALHLKEQSIKAVLVIKGDKY